MNDLISRQAAIDALMAWEEGSVWDDECLKHRGEPYWVAPSDVIERLPSAQPEPRWIACSERLPEKAEGQYWVCTDTGYQCQCRWTDDVYGLGSSGEWAWKIFDIPQYSHVIAWMPLPEPYKAESET